MATPSLVDYTQALQSGAATWSLLRGSSPAPTSGMLPSPELLATMQALASIPQNVPFAVAWDDDHRAETRKMMEMMRLLTGKQQLPAVAAEKLKIARGQQGFWIAYPGVNTADDAPTIIYLHGGGMVGGSALYCQPFLERVSRCFAMRVLAINYPLCPEATAVEAVDAAVASYQHLIEDLSVPAQQVLIMGESGGGQMTLLTLQALAARGLPSPAAGWAMCPVTRSDEVAFKQHDLVTADVLCGNGAIRGMADLIRRAGAADELPYAHPSYSPFFAPAEGLPPVFFSWDSDEVLAFDSEQMVAKLRAANVQVGTSVTGFGLHALVIFDNPEAAHEVSVAQVWLKKFLGAPATSTL